MSKLKLKDEVMMHYAAMLSVYCDETHCSYCPFSNHRKVNSAADCLLIDQRPAQWGEILEKIRKEATDGTQEDHC